MHSFRCLNRETKDFHFFFSNRFPHRNHHHQNCISSRIPAIPSSFICSDWNTSLTTLRKTKRCRRITNRSDVASAKLTLRPFGNGRSKAKLATQRFKILQVHYPLIFLFCFWFATKIHDTLTFGSFYQRVKILKSFANSALRLMLRRL